MSENKKYEFTGDVRVTSGASSDDGSSTRKEIRQIRALRDFGLVRKGDLGGWIESEDNLSHEGYCWVEGNVQVTDQARIFENAVIGLKSRLLNGLTPKQASKLSSQRTDIFIRDKAKVFGRARIFGTSRIKGSAEISGNVILGGHSVICDRARISEKVNIAGYVSISGDSNISGQVKMRGVADIQGQAEIHQNGDWINISQLGAEQENLTAYITKSGDIECTLGGYFEEEILLRAEHIVDHRNAHFSGKLEELETAIRQRGIEDHYAEEYRIAVQLIRAKLQRRNLAV